MKELIELAKQKGFLLNPEHLTSLSSFYVIDIKSLWICELQRWLRNYKDIFVFIGLIKVSNYENFTYTFKYKDEVYSRCNYDTYEDSLHDGCFEALKLID